MTSPLIRAESRLQDRKRRFVSRVIHLTLIFRQLKCPISIIRDCDSSSCLRGRFVAVKHVNAKDAVSRQDRPRQAPSTPGKNEQLKPEKHKAWGLQPNLCMKSVLCVKPVVARRQTKFQLRAVAPTRRRSQPEVIVRNATISLASDAQSRHVKRLSLPHPGDQTATRPRYQDSVVGRRRHVARLLQYAQPAGMDDAG